MATSIQRRDSNLQPSEYESPPSTTRPGGLHRFDEFLITISVTKKAKFHYFGEILTVFGNF